MSGEITADQFEGLVGKVITVQIDIPEAKDGDDTYREITGKCIAGSPGGLAVQSDKRTEIFDVKLILGVEIVPKGKPKIQIRWIDPIPLARLHQHLADRHGMNLGVIQALSPSDAVRIHTMMDHGLLGHRHEPKPRSNVGRPARPVD